MDMNEPQQMKTAQWKNRLLLMQTLTSLRASGNIHSKVEQILRSSKNKEQTAKELVEIINECKTEEEVVIVIKSSKRLTWKFMTIY